MGYDFEKEKQEAIRAGEYALECLQEAEEYLNSARNWGIFDILGGGFISSLIKHSKMNNAQECIEKAQDALRDFSKELRDVDTRYTLEVNSDDFLKFADWFFDGFIADCMMQGRINESREKVAKAIDRIKDILLQLS